MFDEYIDLNKKNFKMFLFSEVFEFKRGSRLTKLNQINGDIPYISSTKNNNGIDSLITPPANMVIYSNKITLTNSGSVGYCFFHDYEFVASDHVTVIWLKNKSVELTKNIGLFLKPIIESMRYKYNFGREISDNRLKKEYILLPINSDNEPDWNFMNDYIESQKETISFSSIINKKEIDGENEEINIENWKYFELKKIFKVERGGIGNLSDLLPGDVPVITAYGYNQGVAMYSDVDYKYCNCLTASLNGTYTGYVAYHNYRFNANSDCGVLIPIDFELNIYTGIFFATVLNKFSHKYAYGRKLSKTRLNREKILLPVNSEGNIDLEFMEKYIKQLEYSNYI